MDKKLSEIVNSTQAVDVLASALIALPGGEDALNAALAALPVNDSGDDD